LVATNSVAGGNNLEVMKAIASSARIFEAWSDEPWTVDGAAVRVAVVCYEPCAARDAARLDGVEVGLIGPDLTSEGSVIHALGLKENHSICFIGTMKNGDFNIPYKTVVGQFKWPTTV
jgi:hypothetical protein